MRIATVTLISLYLFAFSGLKAQKINADELIGVWKMEQSGFIADGKEVVKDFNACRLSQNFVFKQDGTVDYTYYEGDLDTCYIGEVETYNWEIEQDTLKLESRGYYGYYLIKLQKEERMRLQAVVEQREATGDAMLDMMLNTVHFDVYRKQSKPVGCESCRVVLILK